MTYPDPAPVIEHFQHLLEEGVRWAPNGADPRSGFSCYGLVAYAYSLVGIFLPETAEAAEAHFSQVDAPYQPWDVAVFRLGEGMAPRHLGLLLAPAWGFHCGRTTNGLARIRLDRHTLWRRTLARVVRFQEFLPCA